MRHSILVLSLLLSMLLSAGTANAQGLVDPGEADCSTARRALLSWLVNLQDGDLHPEEASRCFDWRAARISSAEQRQELSLHFKQVLDARGLFIVMEDIPDEPEPADLTRVVPFPNNLAGFYLTRRESRWLISVDTIRTIPSLYEETFAVDVEGLIELGPDWLKDQAFGVAWWQIFGLLGAIFLSLITRQFVSWVVRTQATRGLTHMVKRLDAGLVRHAAMPIGTVAMTVFLMWAFPLLRFSIDVNRIALFALRVAAAVSAVLILYRLVDIIADVMAKKAEDTETMLDDQLVPLVRKSLKVITFILGLIFVLQNMEVDVASLLAGVSLGGLAFTLAARDTVANLFGSLSIFADQPFQVGDWVTMQGVEGVVEEVGMRSTRVRTFYRSLVSIPNSKVADGVIDNYGSRDTRRTFLKLGVQYDTSPEQIEAFCDGIRAILSNNSVVHGDYHIYFTGFADSALEIMLYFFFKVDTWTEELRQRHLIFLEILRLAKSLGIEFAFPTRTLHLASQAKPTEMTPPQAPSVKDLGATVLAFGAGGNLARPAGPDVSHGFYFDPSVGGGSDPDADIADSRDADDA